MNKRYLLLFFFFILSSELFAFADSSNLQLSVLNAQLDKETKTSARIDILVAKAEILLPLDYAAAEEALLEAQLLSKDISYQKGLLLSSVDLADLYCYYASDYFKAMKYSSTALLIAKDAGDKRLALRMNQNISFIFESLKDTKKAITYAKNAYRIAKELEDEEQIANLSTLLGRYYEELGDTAQMIHYFQSVFEQDESSVTDGKPQNILSIAKYFFLKGNNKQAESYYEKTLKLCLKNGDYKTYSNTITELSSFYLQTNEVKKAFFYLEKGLAVTDSLQMFRIKSDHYEILAKAYEVSGDYKKANMAINAHYAIRDSLYNEKISTQIFLFEDDFRTLIKENEIQVLKDKELANELSLKNEQLKRNMLFVGLLFVVLSALALYSRLRFTKRSNKQLRDQKDELERLSIVASDINSAVLILDPDKNIEWVNNGFSLISGFSSNEVLGLNLWELPQSRKWKEENVDYAKQMFIAKKPFDIEIRSFKKSGESYWLDMNVTPSFDEDDNLLKFIIVAADVTEKKEAEIKLTHSYKSARLLSELGVGITAAKTVEDIVDIVYTKVNDLLDAACFGVGLMDKENHQLNFVSFIEKGQKYRQVSCDLSDKSKMGVIAMLQNKSFLLNDFEAEYGQYLEGEPIAIAGELPQSLIYVPLWSKGQAIGVLTVQSFEKNAYNDNHYNLAKNIANYMAIAIEKTLLYQGMEKEVVKRTKEIVQQKDELLQTYSNTKLLSEIGLDISSTLNFDEVFQTVHSKISRLMDAEMFGIRIYHEDKQQIEYNYEIESGELDPLGFMNMDDKNNYTVWCVEQKKDIFIKDNDIEYVNYIDTFNVLSGKSPRSLIFTPMIVEGKVVGVLTVQSLRVNAFERHHLDLLKSLGAYVGSALINGRLYSTLETKVAERTEDLAEKNKNITDSINYAKRIQSGILPSDKLMRSLLPKSFVYFKPKDIVSGDFYWMAEKNGKVFVAVVDCTGHGVPGAFMSIIGESLLEQAINEPYINHTYQILDFIQEGLQKLFEQETKAEGYDELFDGMDMSLVAINMHKKRIEYSGASNSLFLVRDNEVERLRGDKFGISAVDYGFRRPFTSQYVDFEAGDAFYIFSDGVPDQFGGPRTKKLGYKNTSILLSTISKLPIDKQLSEVETSLTEWQGNVEQTDDICLFGFKI